MSTSQNFSNTEKTPVVVQIATAMCTAFMSAGVGAVGTYGSVGSYALNSSSKDSATVFAVTSAVITLAGGAVILKSKPKLIKAVAGLGVVAGIFYAVNNLSHKAVTVQPCVTTEQTPNQAFACTPK